MKITLINHSDTQGGASVVTYRLMEALRALGHDARMLVAGKNGSSPYVTQACGKWRASVPFVAEHLRIMAGNGMSKRDLFKASIATDGLPLSKHPLVREADAVILNWVNQGMLSLKEIDRIAKAKPVLWTMHDMWNMTGVCHHAGECDAFLERCSNCHLLNSSAGSNDLSARTFDRKARLYASAPMTFVAVSNWLASRARASRLLGDQRVEVIHNAFPVERYAAAPQYSRADLGLPEGRKLIVFCAARIDDPIKNLPLAVEGLNALTDTHGGEATAVFVGAMRSPDALDGVKLPYVHLGPVSEASRIHSLMSHATAVLSTSHFESLPTVLIEAQAAGATPVGLTHDGRADIITDGVSGYSIASPEPQAVAQALAKAIDSPIEPDALRRYTERFSVATVARQYEELIKNTIK